MSITKSGATYTLTLTGNGSSDQYTNPVVLNYRQDPFSVSLQLSTDGSTTQGTVEYTLDNPQGSYATDFATNATWVAHSDFTNLTDGGDGNIAYPVTAIRLKAGSSGTDVLTLKALQSTYR